MKMNSCKICKSKTKSVINFGKMPIANAFLKDPGQEEYLFNLELMFCPTCLMVQLGETVPPEKMFHDDYQFISSTSSAMAEHFQLQAEEIIERVSDVKKPFVIELGSNDGIMLRHIAKAGINHLGIEPSGNVAKIAQKHGVKSKVAFFNEETAQEILDEHGKVDVMSGSNVVCHIEDINSVFAGVEMLLKDTGVFFFEEPYIFDIVQKSSFDQIYDEHVYYYSGLAVGNLAKRHGLELVDMQHQETHGGSMRYYVQKKGSAKANSNVKEWISKEKKLGLDEFSGFEQFADKVDTICKDLKRTLEDLHKKGHQVAAYAATSKSTTTLNYAQIGPDLLKYICDTTPSKIGKFSPGMHIPVVSYSQFSEDKPKYALLLAWNHQKEIFAKERDYREQGGKFITYFPEVKIHG